MFCDKCGRNILDGALFCSHCGAPTSNGQVQGRGQRQHESVPCQDDEHNQLSPQYPQDPRLSPIPNFLLGHGLNHQNLQHQQGTHLYQMEYFIQGHAHDDDQPTTQNPPYSLSYKMAYFSQGAGNYPYFSQGAGHYPPPAHRPLELQQTSPVHPTTHSLENDEIYTGSQTDQADKEASGEKQENINKNIDGKSKKMQEDLEVVKHKEKLRSAKHQDTQKAPDRQKARNGSLNDQPKPDEPSRLMDNKNNLSILLVGRTGHGKSATGNSLLGFPKTDGFHEKKSLVSVTEKYQRLVKKRFGRILEVVDTPGIFDTSYEHQFVYEQIAQCIGMTLPGFNAIFLVLHSDRFTPELVKTVDIFFKFFGRGVDEYTFVLFTNMESEEEMKNYFKGAEKRPEDEGVKAFESLKKRCQNKLLFIDNKASEDIKEEMVWNILTAVDTANAKSSRPYFANKLTREMEQRAKNFYHTQVFGLTYERSKEDLRILLIGLSGHGKSATRNSIMGKSIFTENASTMGNAYQQTQTGKINGRKIQIVEIPVKDPSIQSETDLKKQILQAEKSLHPGFHAVCFVIEPNKFSSVKDQFKQVMEYFGDDVNDYAFVIMTFSKNEDYFEEHFRSKIEAKHPVTSVLKFCKGKELYIDNNASPQEKKEMIEDMITYIDCENAKKLTPHFSSRFKQLTEASEAAEASKAAEAERQKHEKQYQKHIERKEKNELKRRELEIQEWKMKRKLEQDRKVEKELKEQQERQEQHDMFEYYKRKHENENPCTIQ